MLKMTIADQRIFTVIIIPQSASSNHLVRQCPAMGFRKEISKSLHSFFHVFIHEMSLLSIAQFSVGVVFKKPAQDKTSQHYRTVGSTDTTSTTFLPQELLSTYSYTWITHQLITFSVQTMANHKGQSGQSLGIIPSQTQTTLYVIR